MDSRLVQSYEIFAILRHNRSSSLRKSGIWEEADEECCMERYVEQASICERTTPYHALGFIS